MHLKAIYTLLAVTMLIGMGKTNAETVSIESLARMPAISSVSMSADGKQLVSIVASPGSDYKDTALATWDLDNLDAPPVVTPSGKMKLIAASALKAGRILVTGRQEWTGQLAGCGEGRFSGSTATFVFKSYLTDVKHKDFDEAFTKGNTRVGVSQEMERCLAIVNTAGLVNLLPLEPSKVIVRRVHGLALNADYFLYDLKTDQSELLMRGGERETPGLFHPGNGKLLTRNEIKQKGSDEYEQRTFILNEETDEFEIHEKLTTMLTERFTISIAGRDDESGKYYVLTDQFSDLVQAWMYDPRKREFDSEPLVAHGQFSIAGLNFGNQKSNFNQLLGFTVAGPNYETTYVESNMRSIHEGLKQAYPDMDVFITDYNDGLSRVLFMTESANHPPAYHLLIDRQTVKTLGTQRPWLETNEISKQKWVTYTARDGLKIPAILDIPAGWTKEDGPLPAVVNPHGGPWSRDTTGWDSSGWAAFLTSRGYAVLRPQYRGSQGLGRELWMAGDKEWGLKMQDDLDDGAKWMVDKGYADPAKLAIFGYSYGGFAAAAATVRPDTPFRCAIAGAPVTDLGKLGRTWSNNRLQRLLQGHTVTGMNPMDNTEKAHIPIMLYVGDRDVRTPSWHAKNFYDDVKDRVPAKLELIDDMPHQLPWYYRHHEETLGLIENYLAKDCGFAGP